VAGGENYWNFEVKMQGFLMHFTTKTVRRCKTHHGGWKFSNGAELLNPSPSTRTL